MTKSLSAISLLVPDYNGGLAFFEGALGFAVEEDAPLGAEKRWVVVAPPGSAGAKIVLAVPADERQRARIIDQTGGRVGYFLLTDDFRKDYAALRARGVKFLEPSRCERFGTVAVFVDPWRGKWDLLQPIGVSGEQASSAP
jgi:catechol 2,3-dioxygenase-like lactoylglutathione lyase family enzyme